MVDRFEERMGDGTQELAPLGLRLAGQFIDWGITVGIFLLAVWIEPFADGLATGVAVGALAYYLLCDGLPNGQSLAKRMLSMSVVSADTGRPCTYWKSFLRNIAQVLGILDWLWIFGEKKRRAGDMLAGTIVVRS